MANRQKYEQEYVINTSPKILYNFLATPSGLAEWFADDVNSRGDNYIFEWDGSEEEAELIGKKKGEFIKFKWLEADDEEEYFEFRIEIDDITGDLSLIITDFADDDELEESQMLWDSQINELTQIIGG